MALGEPSKCNTSPQYKPSQCSFFSPTWKEDKPWRLVTKTTRFSTKFHNGLVWPIHDLLATKFLSWIIPTHPVSHLIKFILVLIAVLSMIFEKTLTYLTQHSGWMDFLPITGLFLACVGWIYWYYQDMHYSIGKPWMDPRLPSRNRMEMHVPLRLFQDASKARRAACLPQLVARNTYGSYTSNVINLDKYKWKFHLFKTVEEGLDAVHQVELPAKKKKKKKKKGQRQNGDSAWLPIAVPGHWMLQGFDDIPIYTNKKYPFPCKPPMVPKENPTGVYKFEVGFPSDWRQEGDETKEADQVSIILHGFESMCFVFWNGHMLGFGKDSRLPSEFAIPNELLTSSKTKKAILHIVVVRWSDGSYLEDQDHWWMAGLHRSVELIRRPSSAHILDYHVEANESKDLTVSIQLRQASTSIRLRARLYKDKQLSSDGTQWESADEPLWEKVKTGEKFSIVTFRQRITDVELWTAETPNLYTLVLEQIDSDSKQTTQAESCRVGFRSARVSRGVLHVNGKPITVCGINRHEHDPDHGKVVSLDRMVQDIVVLKQNNFNAVRTAHYPNHSSFYRLCDYFGMYVCDEANVETDGMKPMGRLANDSGWENAFCSRVQRMVRRDINHPCIIMWSLGNESGRGTNLAKARASIRELDNSRPICYEGGGVLVEGTGETELTDIVCPMYPNVGSLTRLSWRNNEDRPIILCEYSHAMNNSNGNLHLYWEKFWDQSHPRLQGGFIWDMIDQGLRKTHEDGRAFFAYGGDFGDKINDRQFCINGMFSPERDPHPSVAEIKYLQQPAAIASGKVLRLRVDRKAMKSQDHVAKNIVLKVTNRYSFIGLDHLCWKWSFFCDSHPGAGVGRDITLENGELRIQSASIYSILESIDWQGCEYGYLSISGALKSSTPWAESGHVVVSEQLPILLVSQLVVPQDRSEQLAEAKTSAGTIKVSENDTSIMLEVRYSKLVVDKASCDMIRMELGGETFLCGQGLRSNFSRAATDNDKGGMELVLDFLAMPWIENILRAINGDSFSYECHWRENGLSQGSNVSRKYTKTVIIHEKDNTRIECDAVLISEDGYKLMALKLIYRLYKDGRVDVDTQATPRGWLRDIPSLARVGLSLTLPAEFNNISYFGKGPHENYPDRKAGGQMGLWETSPSRMGYDYIVPSENGNRSDCKWVAFRSDKGGAGVLIRPNNKKSSFCFSGLLHTGKELHQAHHTIDLDDRKDGVHPIHVNLDHRLMGVGGDVSWFPVVYPQYLVKCNEYHFGFSFLPFEKGQSPDEAARGCSL